ncbi:hypothetical protein M407DRAFT_64497 [Tulasnella calospora MUT 4182]|uniref:Major facilitator superfamily (MFS) profile domain-containing protein n=1 Tax=Tulasnella calospora MUT 4182 TaxID=1051891 RepID=A0A0C3QMY3_9AGAM|nr:hypothetical protein M407DRAFT_64497 [Tulasnella calospora MUT 4182]
MQLSGRIQTPRDPEAGSANSSRSAIRRSNTPSAPEPQKPSTVLRWFDYGSVLPTLQNPRSYTRNQKIIIVVIVALCSFSAPFASNIMMPSFPFIGPSLGLGQTGVTLTTALYMAALGIGPLYHAFLSERFGRRPVYLGGFILFTLASVACAVAPDGDDLVAYRFFQAFGSSAAQSIGMGTISDIYIPSERGRATGFWFIGPILGPMISPLIGGAVYQWMGWRAILWTTAIFGVILLVLITLFLPETSLKLKAQQTHPPSSPSLNDTTCPLPAPVTDASPFQGQPTRTRLTSNVWKGAKFAYTYGIYPLSTVGRLLFPPVGLSSLYASLCFGSLYAISVATPFSFSEPPYKLGSMDISFLYLPACVGYCLGSVVGGYLSDREVRKAKESSEDGETYSSEVRLRSARWGVPLVPAGLLIFGWGLHRHTHMALPIMGGFVFGVGLMLTNGTIMAYFSDSIPGQTASVVAAYNALRNLIAGTVAALTTAALDSGLRENWYFTILALACLAGSVCLEVIQRYGAVWRQRRQQKLNQEAAPATATAPIAMTTIATQQPTTTASNP